MIDAGLSSKTNYGKPGLQLRKLLMSPETQHLESHSFTYSSFHLTTFSVYPTLSYTPYTLSLYRISYNTIHHVVARYFLPLNRVNTNRVTNADAAYIDSRYPLPSPYTDGISSHTFTAWLAPEMSTRPPSSATMARTTGPTLQTSRYAHYWPPNQLHIASTSHCTHDRADSPFQITPEEMTVIVDALNDQTAIFGTGFKVDGEKYTVIRADDSVLLGKKVRCPSVPSAHRL